MLLRGRFRRTAWLPTATYKSRFGATWQPVEAARPVDRPKPRQFGRETAAAFIDELPASAPEFGVLSIDGGSAYGAHGWVIGKNRTLLPEFSWYGGPNARLRLPRHLPVARSVNGTCLSLVTEWSSENYAHFVLDALGRLALFDKSTITLADVDHVYCPRPLSSAASDLLDRFGVPDDKRIWAGRELLVQADVLPGPSLGLCRRFRRRRQPRRGAGEPRVLPARNGGTRACPARQRVSVLLLVERVGRPHLQLPRRQEHGTTAAGSVRSEPK